MAGQERKYQAVIDWIRNNMENGSLKGGDRLMSEKQIGERFGLSRETVRRATGELVNAGVLERVKGSGTYVRNVPDTVVGCPVRESCPAGEAGTVREGGPAGEVCAVHEDGPAGEVCAVHEEDPAGEAGAVRESGPAGYAETLREPGMVRESGTGMYGGGRPAKAAERNIPVRRTVRYRNVAVVSTFSESYIFPMTLRGIEQGLSENGYTTQISFTDNRVSREREILNGILEKDQIDGLIVEPSQSALPNPNLRCYREIARRGIPILFFNARYPGIDAPCVRIDDFGTAAKAVELLYRHGHRKIAGIFKSDDGQGPLRYAGYLNKMTAYGLRTEPDAVIWVDTPMLASLGEAADHLFRRLHGCTGVVCYNDEAAWRVIDLARKRGIGVPEELSVVGIDDSPLAQLGPVPFTSFVHPKEILGRKAAENLAAMIENPGFDGNTLYECEAAERDSVADLPCAARN